MPEPTGHSNLRFQNQNKRNTCASKPGVAADQSFDTLIQIAINRLLDFLCDAPMTRELPGIKYRAAHELEDDKHHFTAVIPLKNVSTSTLRIQQAGDIITVLADAFHENGEPKLHWTEGTSGYGTWQRRFRIPVAANPNSLRIIPGPKGIEIILDNDSSGTSLAA